VRRAKKVRTTIADKDGKRAGDLLERDFTAPAPNRVWVTDIQCRRRHWKSYADFRTMPTLLMVVQVIGGTQVRKVGIVPAS
jgi:hypothetical protein